MNGISLFRNGEEGEREGERERERVEKEREREGGRAGLGRSLADATITWCHVH